MDWNEVRLREHWPKWWAKFEIYKDLYHLSVPVLVVDLDTVFLKTLEIRHEHKDELLIIRDVWKDGNRFPERLGGGFMYLPAWARRTLWDDFNRRGPKNVIAEFGGDDQPYLHQLFSEKALRFQDEYVDEIVSYKVHVRGIGLQEDNKVVYFHGKPRPWDVDESWIPKLGENGGTEIVGLRREASVCSG
jgi:hypothetical protein